MNLIKKYRSFLLEKNEQKKFGYVKLQLDSLPIEEIYKMISFEDLDTKLIEDTHLTLLYGLHSEVTAEQVLEKLKNIEFSNVKLENISIFNEGSREVLKFDVTGKNIIEANKKLKELPYTSFFTDFKPHITIAYLKPGTSEKYVQLLKDKSFELKPTVILYKDTNKNIFKIK
jgi:2'-5' RNA ligase